MLPGLVYPPYGAMMPGWASPSTMVFTGALPPGFLPPQVPSQAAPTRQLHQSEEVLLAVVDCREAPEGEAGAAPAAAGYDAASHAARIRRKMQQDRHAITLEDPRPIPPSARIRTLAPTSSATCPGWEDAMELETQADAEKEQLAALRRSAMPDLRGCEKAKIDAEMAACERRMTHRYEEALRLVEVRHPPP